MAKVFIISIPNYLHVNMDLTNKNTLSGTVYQNTKVIYKTNCKHTTI